MCAKYDKNAKRYSVHITDSHSIHNHEVSEERYKEYPQVRVVKDADALRTIGQLSRYGASKKGIMRYITENTTANPTSKDVWNLLARMKSEEYADCPSVEERVDAFLQDFCSQTGNVGRTFTGVDSVLKALTLQTAHMRSMFESFPEVLLIDATHNTNNAHYKLFSFMVHDALGNGQHVQHSLIEDETYSTLTTVCEQFKSANPSHDKLKCIVVDKDFTEIAAIQSAFPGVRVLLCQWHVQKYLSEEVVKAKYALTDYQKTSLKLQFRRLIAADSETQYARRIEYIKAILGSPDKVSSWFNYFDANWDACKEKWCSYLRCDVPHLGNNTNNRLESSWHKLKGLVNKFSNMDECLASILFWQRSKEVAWEKRLKVIGVTRVSGADAELNKLAAVVSEYTFKLIREQYDFAMKPSTKYQTYSQYPPIHFVTYKPHQPSDEDEEEDSDEDSDAGAHRMVDDVPETYAVDVRQWTCSCPFMTTRLLPCRHVLYLRRLKHPSAVIPISKIKKRWLLAEVKRILPAADLDTNVDSFATVQVAGPTPRPLASNERYNALLTVGKQIASAGGRYGTVHVRALEDALTSFLKIVEAGGIPLCLIGSSAEQQPSDELPEQSSLPELSSLPEFTSLADSPTVAEQPTAAEQQTVQSSDHSFEPLTDSQITAISDSQVDLLLDVVSGNLLPPQRELSDAQATKQPRTDSTRDAEEAKTDDNDNIEARGGDPSGSSDDDFEIVAAPSTVKSVATKAPPFVISKKAPVPGKPREAKSSKRSKVAEQHKTADKSFEYFEASGGLPSLAAFRRAYMARNISYQKSQQLLNAIVVLNSYNKPRVFVLTEKDSTPEEELSAALNLVTIERMEEAMRSFIARTARATKQQLSMTDLVVLVDKRVYSNTTIRLMRLVISTKDFLALVAKTIMWLGTNPNDFEAIPQDHKAWLTTPNKPVELERAVKNLNLTSPRACFLYFCTNELVDIDSIANTLSLFERSDSSHKVISLPPYATTLPDKTPELLTELPQLHSLDENDALDHCILAAIFFKEPRHWCAVVGDTKKKTIFVFDPLQNAERYMTLEWWCEHAFEPAIRREKGGRYKLKRFHGWHQRDLRNCGVLTLLFLEWYAKLACLPELVPESLERFVDLARYRYMCAHLCGET